MSYYAKRFFGQQQGIVTDGLKLWLDASNPLSYPGSGTTWFDLSGNGNNGTLVNGVAFSNGAMVFDGVNDYISFNNSLYVSNSIGHSISIWIKRGNNPPYQGIMTIRINSVKSNILMMSGTSSNYSLAYGGVGLSPKSLITPLTVGQWHNVTFVALNGTSKVYINGIENTKTYSPSYAGFNEINKFGQYGNNWMLAEINDTLIYQKALTKTEVLQNFNATKSKYGL